ncbi:hypothetical protein [Donghicola mangrovi]|uniref:Uncharacterized protein n=1 Tax=Donghicola mangrovi TaxID=2729614 RepID=A0A850QAB8_9RHOB|nr:hypothetical protein [Donghicola mangrovi]NVO23760.1 hypothetical protein [Donghicola mangrovi]
MDRGPEAGSGIRNHYSGAALKERFSLRLVFGLILFTLMVATAGITLLFGKLFGLEGKTQALMFMVLFYLVQPIVIGTVFIVRSFRRNKTQEMQRRDMDLHRKEMK